KKICPLKTGVAPTVLTLPAPKVKITPLLIDVPFVGRPTFTLGKRLINIVKEIRPDVVLQPIPRPLRTIQTYFPRKDALNKNLQSNIVYKISCNDCSNEYIGKSWRQATRRHREHGAPVFPVRSQQQPAPIRLPAQQQRFDTTVYLRRSTRNLNKKIIYNPVEEPIEDELATIITAQKNSAIQEHERQTGHTVNWNDWKIIGKDLNRYRLSIRETLAIMKEQPELNKTV
ncbi:unnamed protein product, partial [Didymodactylos carnosus]